MKRFMPRWLARWFAPTATMSTAAMSAPMLDCASVMRTLWDYVDAELTPQRMDEIRVHIEMCQRCYPQYAFERSFLDAIAARGRTHSDPGKLRASLLQALQAKGLSEA
jgi:anti-sigma factor (TIGR02949 family)